MSSIFITGGAGYIGSHTCVTLLEAGCSVTVFDNLANSSTEALRRVEELTGKKINFIKGDICNAAHLTEALSSSNYDAVIHFAGLKAVGESVVKPLLYYQNNLVGTLNLLNAMQQQQIFNLVFSSSATVYGDPGTLPIKESAARYATNPYGRSKLMIEHMLEDVAVAEPRWNICSLRYFNPVGAHSSGLIGEDPNGIPNNLMPFISQVAVGRREKLSIFGSDYQTVDGTGVRDYIHVVDLSEGHLAALDYLLDNEGVGFMPVNLGTGQGVSVLQMLSAFEDASGVVVPYEIADRRPGDIAACYADATKASTLLGWQAKYEVKHMCEDSWRWQSANPNGYGTDQ